MSGLYFEELKVGQLYQHALRRTIAESDNIFFSALTHNPAQLHLDEEYCRAHSPFGQRILNSGFTLALMVGVADGDATLGAPMVNLGWDDVVFPNPVFHGDTLHFETEIESLRESTSRPTMGVVVFAHRAFNQRDELVGACTRTGLHRKHPAPAEQV